MAREMEFQPNPDRSAGSQSWSGSDCLRVLYRRKAAVLWITCLGVLAAALIAAVQPRLYQSRASLEVQGLNENFLNLRDIYAGGASIADAGGGYMQTQVELLQQDALIEKAARKLRLEGQPEPALSLEKLRREIKIVPLKNSRIIEIVCESRAPQFSAALANTLAETFIEQSIENRQRDARQTYESLRPQVEEVRHKLAASDLELGGLLTPGGEADRRFYDAILLKANDARMAATIRQSNIRLVGPAVPAKRPYKPNLPMSLAIGLLGGLVAAVGYVMLQEQNDSVLRSPGDAGTCLTLPELGAIPKAGSWKLAVLGIQSSRNGTGAIELAGLEQRTSGVSESFRTTCASILSAGRNGDCARTLLVTSSRPMEGKTTVVSNLGIALAEIGSRVLLIDGDMRRPRLHSVFDQPNSWGLSDVLREKNAIDELPLDVLVKKTAVPHLYLLPSGACTDNIFGLLCSGRMSRLLPRFREEFDYVLVDAPPCLEFADARIMARYTEELVLVVRANYTERKTAQAAVERLRLDGIPVMGVILNRWDPARSDMYRYPAFRSLDQQEAL
jgi:succinoglycan biosynthesis transport protein ExoP